MPLTPYPGGGGSGGGGGGSGKGGLSPYPGGGGGGSSSGGGSRKKKSAPNVNHALVQVASRLARVQGPQHQQAVQAVGEALHGYTPDQIIRASSKAGLTGDDATSLVNASRAKKPGTPLIVPVLDYASRPDQAIKGAITESAGKGYGGAAHGVAKGASRGFTGKEAYSGSETLGALIKGSKKGGKQFSAGLSPGVRIATDIGVDVVASPSTYVTLGGGTLAENAARTVAKEVAGQAVTDAALNPASKAIFENIVTRGAKALTKEQKALVPRALLKKADRAAGGVRFAGQTIPGTRKLNQAIRDLGPKNSESIAGGVEHSMRPRAEFHQAQRANEVAKGTAQDIENIQAQQRGADFLAGLKPTEAQRGVQATLGRSIRKPESAFNPDTGMPLPPTRAEIRVGGRELKKNPDLLNPVREALDVQGGKAAVEALPPAQQKVAQFLRDMSNVDETTLRASGRIGPNVTPQERYIYHYPAETAARSTERVTSPSTLSTKTEGFLKSRTSQEPASANPEKYGQNPIVAMGKHGAGTVRQAGNDQAIHELRQLSDSVGDPLIVTKDSGVDIGEKGAAKYTKMELPVERAVAGGGTETVKETVHVHRLLVPYFKKMLASQEDHFLKRNILYLNALWARYATASTGFISRNVLQGNLYMGMVLGEARDPRIWASSLGTMSRMQRGIARLGNPYAYLKPEEVTLVKGALENNAVESNFLQQISEQAAKATKENAVYHPSRVTAALKTGRGSPFSTNNILLERVSAANQWAEGWGRLSVYANKLKQGYAPPEAAAIARRVMLDYKDLSPVNDVARTVNPFLTWTYKSVPLILGTLARDPRKVNIPLTILRDVGAEGTRSEGIGVQPRWQVEAGGVTLPKSVRTHLPGSLGQVPQTFLPDSPLNTTNDALAPVVEAIQAAKGKPGAWQEVARDAINQVGPGGVLAGTAKSLVEAATQTQLFSGRQYKPGSRVPTPFPFNKIIGPTMPWEAYNTLQNLAPVTPRANTLVPHSPYDKAAQTRRLISLLGGVTLFPQTGAGRRSEKYRRIAELNTVIEAIRGQGGRVPHHSQRASSGGSKGGYQPLGK